MISQGWVAAGIELADMLFSFFFYFTVSLDLQIQTNEEEPRRALNCCSSDVVIY